MLSLGIWLVCRVDIRMMVIRLMPGKGVSGGWKTVVKRVW